MNVASRCEYHRIVVLGSSALKIGEAGEFDYSGTQAIKALSEEGIETVLVNPNIATIQTSEGLADRVYLLPVTPEFVEKVIEKERPDGIILGFGGQTALNCGLALAESGVLDRYGVAVVGTSIETIHDTEDRGRFASRLDEIEVKTAHSEAVSSTEAALEAAERIGYPVMLRIAYALGGLGAGVCKDAGTLRKRVSNAFSHTNQVLIEEYLEGWKEIEYEVVRDEADNCVTVCNMENVDPMGIHTGESIVVAPSQTLTNQEYHNLRAIATQVVRHLGIVGECNIQYALDPDSDDYRVIEVNARLSRSSALASKATGYPLAFVAAKLILGYTLDAIPNRVTGSTSACFEPALDYVVVKAPRWDLKKFRDVTTLIGSGMKSVGEVMAIGRSFEEALQKAVRMLDIGIEGVLGNDETRFECLDSELRNPTDLRLFAIGQALLRGDSLERVHELTKIDKWFLKRIQRIVELGNQIEKRQDLDYDSLLKLKQHGFSDAELARLTGTTPANIRTLRADLGVHPVVKQVDTLAAEYPAQTNYLYLTYHGTENDVAPSSSPPVLVLGSGAYRIGSSVEFDWCCVNSVRTLRELGYVTLMLNCNPETVSTDYDECDRLYFEEISLETILEIERLENPFGVIVSMGGQTPNSIAMACADSGLKILGTSARNIDRAEDRHKFSGLCDELGIAQPPWAEVVSNASAEEFANKVGYPVLIRPSYVLSGAAMAVAEDKESLQEVLARAAETTSDHPTVVSKFIRGAKEIEVDAVAEQGKLLLHVVSEHVENAGVHSGDATLVLPPQRMYVETARRVRRIATEIARSLSIHGPFNIQFLAHENQVSVIECNLRASRSFPFASKVTRENMIDIATRVIMDSPATVSNRSALELDCVGVKAPEFSFTRLEGVDPTLGVEMASTGEVACIGTDFEDAFLKALISVGYRLPIRKVLLSTGPVESKAAFLASARDLTAHGVEFYGTVGTAAFMEESGISVTPVAWPSDEDSPTNAIDLIANNEVDLVINIPKDSSQRELENDYSIRRAAVDHCVPLITNIQLAQRLASALRNREGSDLEIMAWQEYGGSMVASSAPSPELSSPPSVPSRAISTGSTK